MAGRVSATAVATAALKEHRLLTRSLIALLSVRNVFDWALRKMRLSERV